MFNKSGWAAALAVCLTSVVPSDAFAQAVAKDKNELTTEIFVISTKTNSDDSERSSQAQWTTSYARFWTNRFAAGPLFKVAKSSGSDTLGYVGAQGRYYFGNLDARAIPMVEISSSRSFNDPTADSTDLQLLAGLTFPMGGSGGRFRIAPYYYHAFYDEAKTGYSNFHSFGISWSVALLF